MSAGIRVVAQKTGLSVATVSRALRGFPSVRAETRARVEKAAKLVGYRRATLVGAVLASVRRARHARFAGNLAVLDVHPAGRPERLPFHQSVLTGAQRRAQALGFALDVIDVGAGGHAQSTLVRMLRARGVLGLVVFHQERTAELAGFPWEEFAVAEIDHGAAEGALHCVCVDHHTTFTEALARLTQLGYRRAGLFIEEHKDARLSFKWTAAFLAHQAKHRESGHVPILTKPLITEADLEAWRARHRPDLLIGHKDTLLPWLRLRRKDPALPGFFNLNWNDRTVSCAGIDQRPELQGEVAVESVVAQIHRHERGLPADPQTIMVSGRWTDGPTLRT